MSEVENKLGNGNMRRYWVITASVWKISDFANGEEQNYNIFQKNNKKHNKHTKDIQPGDLVLGYQKEFKAIVAVFEVSNKDSQKYYIKKIKDLPNHVGWDIVLNKFPNLLVIKQSAIRCELNEEQYNWIVAKGNNKTTEATPQPVPNEKDIAKAIHSENPVDDIFSITEAQFKELDSLLHRKKNVILQGPPGVGKTYAARKIADALLGTKDGSRICSVQFNQNYSYEDFICGYKPNENGGFVWRDGLFLKFCKQAQNDQGNKYALIIDEINRGNISKIFGELLSLMESSYRGPEHKLSLPNGEDFYVPENLYVIGMMNTADRSLAMIDYALRRRFGFFNMEPAFGNEKFEKYKAGLQSASLNRLVNTVVELNRAISEDPSLGKGFCIGHSYFCEIKQGSVTHSVLSSIVEYDLIPLLQEYWFEDDDKVNAWSSKMRDAIRPDDEK